jgi:hypothetical protein
LERTIYEQQERIDHLEIKEKQVELYKEQNNNFKRQIQAFEQKLILEGQQEEYRKMTESKMVHDTEERFNQLFSKINELNEENLFLKTENVSLLDSKEELEERLTTKSKDLQEITISLKHKIESLNEKKEKSIFDLETKLEAWMKSKSRLEAKLSDQKTSNEYYESKISSLETSLEKDHSLIDSLRKELEKWKRTNSEISSKLSKFRTEKEKNENIEKRIKEWYQKLEKMNREVDLERKKNARLGKENNNLKKDVDTLKEKLEGENNPDLLKQKIIDLNAKITNLKKDKESKAKEIGTLVNKIDKLNQESKQVIEYFASEIQSLSTWICSWLNSQYVFSLTEKDKQQDNYQLPKCIDFPKVIETKPEILEKSSKILKIPAIPYQIDSLKKLLRKSQVSLIESATSLQNTNESLLKELSQTENLKNEITSHLSNLTSNISTTKSDITNLTIEKSALLNDLTELKQKLVGISTSQNELKSEYEQFLWDILFTLHTAKNKYAQIELFTTHIHDINSEIVKRATREIELPETQKLMSRGDRKTAIIKLSGILVEMVGVSLNEQTANQRYKSELDRSLEKMERLNLELATQKEEFEERITHLIEERQEESDIKSREMEEMQRVLEAKNSVLKEQVDDLRKELKAKQKKIGMMEGEANGMNGQVQAQMEVIGHMEMGFQQMATRVDDLVFQKKFLVRLWDTTKESYGKTWGFLERVYYKIRELNLESSCDDVSEIQYQNDSSERPELHPILKFRKCVLSVIALNRIKFLVKESSSKPNISDDDIFTSTPNKNDDQESIVVNLFQKQNYFSTSKRSESVCHMNSSNSKYLRKIKNPDLFPYINFNSMMVKKLVAKMRSDRCSINNQGKS